MEQKLLNKLLAVFDTFTGLFTSITGDHKYIHDGIGYSLLVDTNILGNEAYLIGFHTPSTGYIHFRPAKIGSISSGTKCFLYSGRAYTEGTLMTSVNKNENSTNTSGVVFYGDVTSPITGTIKAVLTTGSGGGNFARSGGASSSSEEVVLKQDTDYVYDILNVTSTATDVLVDLFYYEEAKG